jgi:UMF1 family MFS transporter
MLYNNALVTVFVFGAVYAAGRFGMSLTEVGLFGITLNVTAGLGAWGFGWVDDRLGSKRAVLLSLAGLTVTGAGALLSESVTAMWCWAGLLGIFVGPSQAASRTLMARLSPPERLAEYFGLYTLSGNLTAFAGPVLVGLITQWSGDVRLGLVLVVAPMIALGALLLVPVNAGSGASR